MAHVPQPRRTTDLRALQTTERIVGVMLYTVVAYIGMMLLYMPEERYPNVTWQYVFDVFPNGQLTWGLILAFPSWLGLIAMLIFGSERARMVDVNCSGLLGMFLFVLGVFFITVVVREPNGNPNGPALYWLVAALFSIRAILNLKRMTSGAH